MEEQTEESTEQKYTKADMASLLYPIYTNEENYQNPEWVDGEFNKVLEAYPEDQWDEEALTYFSTQYDDYKKAAKIKNYKDTSPLESIPFPEFTEEDTEETKVAKLEQWGEETKAARHKEDPVWYHKNKFEANEFIDGFVQQEKRKALGEDSGVIRDTISRTGQGAANFLAKTFNASDDTLRGIDDFFEENPKYDEGLRGEFASGIGSFAPQFGIASIGTAAATGAAALAGAPAVAVGAIGTGAFVTINALLSGKNIHADYYDEVFRQTGNEALATDIALKNTAVDLVPQIALDSLFGAKVAKKLFGGLSGTTKRKIAAGKYASLKSGTSEGITEAVQEGQQNISFQVTQKQFTGEEVDYGEAGRAAAIGGAVGATVAGGLQKVADTVNPNEDVLLAREQKRLARKRKIQEANKKIAETDETLNSLKDNNSNLRRKNSLPESEYVRINAELEKFSEGSIKKPFLEYNYLTSKDLTPEVLEALDLVAINSEAGGVKIFKDTPKNKKLISKESLTAAILDKDEYQQLTESALATKVSELLAYPETTFGEDGQGNLPLPKVDPAKPLNEKAEFKSLMEEAAVARKELAKLAKERAPDPRQGALDFSAPDLTYPETTFGEDGQGNLPLPKVSPAKPLNQKKLVQEAKQSIEQNKKEAANIRKELARLEQERAPDPRQEALDFSPEPDPYADTEFDAEGQGLLALPEVDPAKPFDPVAEAKKVLKELDDLKKSLVKKAEDENASKKSKNKIKNLLEKAEKAKKEIERIRPKEVKNAQQELLDFSQKETDTKEITKKLKDIEKRIRESYVPPSIERSKLEQLQAEELPTRIAELEAELEAVPTKEALQDRMTDIVKIIAQAESDIKNQNLTPDQEAELLSKVADLGQMYADAAKSHQKEIRGGKLTRRRKAIERDLREARVKLEAAEAGYRGTKAKGVTPSMVKSNATGVVYSGSIDVNMRAYMNALFAGFNLLPDSSDINLPDNIVVATVDEFKSGITDDYFTGEAADIYKKIKERVNRTEGNSKFDYEGMYVGLERNTAAGKVPIQAVILLQEPNFNEKNAMVASHEIGHSVENILFKYAPEHIKKEVLREFERARKAALQLETIGEASTFMGDIRKNKSKVSPKNVNKNLSSYKYRFAKNPGSSEWFANQFAEFAMNPENIAVSPAQKLMKAMGDFYHHIWDTFRSFFPQQAPTLREWLNDQFDKSKFKETMLATFKEAEKDLKDTTSVSKPQAFSGSSELEVTMNFMLKMEEIGKPSTEQTSENRSRLSERIFNSTKNKTIKEYTKDLYYNRLKLDATYKEIQKDVTEDNVQGYAAEFLKSIENVDINPSVKTLYYAAITNKLEAMGDAASDPDVAEALYELSGALHEKMSFFSTSAGQMISALRVLGKLSPRGRRIKMQKEIERMYDKMKVELPPNYKEVIADIEKKYRKDLEKYTDGFQAQEVYRRMHEELEEQMGLLAPTSPFNFYWYGNMLSSPKTLAINFIGPLVDLVFRQSVMLMADPKNIGVTFSALGKAFSKGITAWKASQQGIDIRSVLSDKYGFKYSAITPYIRTQNKAIEGGVNSYLKMLAKYPFNIMRGTDMLIATTAYELRAHTAMATALRQAAKENNKSLSSYELGRAIDEKLGQTEERIRDYTERATKEIDALYDLDTDVRKDAKERNTKIKLRVMELMDNMRRNESPEVYQEAERYGSLITYNNKPEGIFGAIADGIEKLNERIGSRVGNRFITPFKYTVMPFVGVVSNVISRHLDYSPIGIWRGAKGLLRAEGGNHIFNQNDTEFSKHESLERALIGATSTFLLGGFASYVAGMMEEADEKGEKSYIEWSALGPKDPSTRKDWLSKGNQPYSIRFGDFSLKYSEIPGAPLLAAIGGMFDAMRFTNKWDKEDLAGRSVLVAIAYGGSVLNMSFLRGLKNLWDMAEGKGSPASLAGTFVAGLTPMSGALSFTATDVADAAGIMDADKLDYKDVKAHFIGRIPYFRSFVKKDLNVFGEPLSQGGRFFDVIEPDPVFKFLADNDISVPGTTTYAIGSGRTKAEKRWFAWAKNNREDLLESRYYGENLTEDEMEAVMKISGPRIKAKIQALMNVQARYSKAQLQKIVRKIATDERRRAKFEVISESLK